MGWRDMWQSSWSSREKNWHWRLDSSQWNKQIECDLNLIQSLDIPYNQVSVFLGEENPFNNALSLGGAFKYLVLFRKLTLALWLSSLSLTKLGWFRSTINRIHNRRYSRIWKPILIPSLSNFTQSLSDITDKLEVLELRRRLEAVMPSVSYLKSQNAEESERTRIIREVLDKMIHLVL